MEHYNLAIVTGRFHPFCKAHLEAIAAIHVARLVIIVIGDDMPRSARYPFTAAEQMAMIRAERPNAEVVTMVEALAPAERARLILSHLPDETPDLLAAFDEDYGDELEMELPDTQIISLDQTAQKAAETARHTWFSGNSVDGVSEAALALMQTLRDGPEFSALKTEHSYVEDYKIAWQAAPYSPIFVTVDTLIQHDNKVLLIQRGGMPGRGHWALPGGFVDGNETLFLAALRELCEETGLFLTRPKALAHLKGQKLFDQPRRAARGRTITHGFYFDLTGIEMPQNIAAGDDATALKWVPIETALNMRSQMFEDHYLLLTGLLMLRAFSVQVETG